jgi:type IV secretory pathway VirB10-like protein
VKKESLIFFKKILTKKTTSKKKTKNPPQKKKKKKPPPPPPPPQDENFPKIKGLSCYYKSSPRITTKTIYKTCHTALRVPWKKQPFASIIPPSYYALVLALQ